MFWKWEKIRKKTSHAYFSAGKQIVVLQLTNIVGYNAVPLFPRRVPANSSLSQFPSQCKPSSGQEHQRWIQIPGSHISERISSNPFQKIIRHIQKNTSERRMSFQAKNKNHEIKVNVRKKTDGIKLIGPKGLKLYNLLLFSITPITPTTYLQWVLLDYGWGSIFSPLLCRAANFVCQWRRAQKEEKKLF